MKYQVVMIYTTSTGTTSSVVSFNCEKAAKQAKSFFEERNRSMMSSGFCQIFTNPQTVESLFIDLMKANPYGDVNQLMAQAESAIKLLEGKV